MELKVIDNKGQESRSLQASDALTSAKGSKSVLHETILAFLAEKRSGTHATKTRSDVSGGGLKPWRQKGTGRARSGSIRSPLWRHGGIIFGPVPRDYAIDIPKKKRRLAFGLAVKGLVEDNRLQVVEPIALTEAKTKNVASVYKKWQAPKDSLFVVEKLTPEFARASRNIENVRVSDVGSLNAYDCLRARRVFITEAALNELTSRLEKKLER